MICKLPKEVVTVLVIVALFLSSLEPMVVGQASLNSQTEGIQVSRMLSSFGLISSAQVPVSTIHGINGIWTLVGQLTASNCDLLRSMGIENVYSAVGDWHTNGLITYHDNQNEQDIINAVNVAHLAGLKVYAWVMEGYGGAAMDLSNSSLRTTAINNLINLVQTLGFDGIADDVELWHEGKDLVAYFNAATVAMHSIGREYFTALVMGGYWDSHQSEYEQINVDRIQPMLYLDSDISWMTETRFKTYLDFCLQNANSYVGIGLMSTGPESRENAFVTALKWIDEQMANGTPTTNLGGVDIWWLSYMDSNDWSNWNAWITS